MSISPSFPGIVKNIIDSDILYVEKLTCTIDSISFKTRFAAAFIRTRSVDAVSSKWMAKVQVKNFAFVNI